MEVIWIGLVGLIGVALVAIAAVFIRRGAPTRAQGERLLALERDLAAERIRLARLEPVERELELARQDHAAERDARLAAETTLSALRQAKEMGDEARADLVKRCGELEGRLNQQSNAALVLERELRDQIAAGKSELSRAAESLAQERRQAEEKLKVLQDARESLTAEFKALATEVMATHGEAFTKKNKEQLDVLLNPFKEKLTEFEKGLQTAHTESAKERATLAEQIRQLGEQSARMTLETVNLTRALKGGSQTQGAWGELVLSRLLEMSGLREGVEYVTQETHTNDDGQRLRPDVIVNLPGNQHVIIDAKVSLKSFEAYVNAEDEDARATHLGAHLASVRNHIKTLAAKDYQTIAGGHLDYVLMFIPIEGAFAAAVERDPEITAFAVERNVALTTPTTLMVVLRTIEGIWKVERRNRNAEVIAKRAGQLHDKFVGFLKDMQAIGDRLDGAQKAYEGAYGKLHTGRGNLVRQAEQLKALGARTQKRLPGAITLGLESPEDEEVWEFEDTDTVRPTGLIAGSLDPDEVDLDP